MKYHTRSYPAFVTCAVTVKCRRLDQTVAFINACQSHSRVASYTDSLEILSTGEVWRIS